jgi:prepilin-type N-terminal cleavage/methylation domain-containing protein
MERSINSLNPSSFRSLSDLHNFYEDLSVNRVALMFVLFQPRSTGGLTLNEYGRFGSPDFRASRSKRGFSLVEMTVAIAMILVLAGAASLSIKPYLAYRDGRAAGEMLRAVKAAQLMYLSDNPATPVANLTQALLLPYMPNATWPTLPSVNGRTPTIDCTKFPPVAVLNGAPYDPSGSTTDGLWDVGQY